MHRNTKLFILKIFVLSSMIILIFNIGDYYLKANTNTTVVQNKSNVTKENINHNKQSFKKANYSGLGNTSIAITTNIGSSYSQINKLPATIYQEIFSISELINNNKAQDELIGNNMIIIGEYLNVLKTDVKQLINSNLDRLAILNAYVDQLEYRYDSGIESQKILLEQKSIFLSNMSDIDNNIEILKAKISEDFKNSNSNESLENINSYLELKNEYYNAKIYVSYINKFLIQYQFLNDYSRNLATIMIRNKEAIIKDAYLVIPENGGLKSLSDFNLIYNEGEIK